MVDISVYFANAAVFLLKLLPQRFKSTVFKGDGCSRRLFCEIWSKMHKKCWTCRVSTWITFLQLHKRNKKDRLQLIFSPTHKTITLFMSQALHSPKWDLFFDILVSLEQFWKYATRLLTHRLLLTTTYFFQGNLFLLLLHGSKMNYLIVVNTHTAIFPLSGGKIYSWMCQEKLKTAERSASQRHSWHLNPGLLFYL